MSVTYESSKSIWQYRSSEIASKTDRMSLSRSGFTVGRSLTLIGTLLGRGRVNTKSTRIDPSMSLWWVCWATCHAIVSRQVFSFGLAAIMRPFPT